MKKILFFILLIVLVPYIIVTIFIEDNEIKFIFKENMKVRVKHEDTGIIDVVPFEEYVTGVLAGEMPTSFHIEALKAQAVAARSYVMKKMEYNKDRDYDVVDTIMNQVYLSDDYLRSVWKESYNDKINKIKTAVIETKGEYISYNGDVAEAFFFSTSVGATENSGEIFSKQLPYLVSVSSTWDEISPLYSTNKTISLKEFYNLLGLSYSDTLDIEKIDTTSTGRVNKIKINGNTFTGGQMIDKLNLRSSFFEITKDGENVVINTKGYGHGVGMSQYGAEGMARAGYTYDQILKYYYTGVEIKKI